MLFVCSTPIGNLGDVSFRLVDVLREADLILAEDTRRTSVLLKKFDISKKVISFNDHNKERKTPSVIKELIDGRKIALLSDAGTPAISDPGFYIVREAVRNDVQIVPVPGASAFVSALSCSGLPTDRFTFFGFIPKKGKVKFFSGLVGRKETLVFYESPYRIVNTIGVIKDVMPNASLVIARELTKKFEEFIRGSSVEVYDIIKDRKIKGEITICLKQGKC